MGSAMTKICASEREKCAARRRGSGFAFPFAFPTASPKFGKLCISAREKNTKTSIEDIKNKKMYLDSVILYRKQKKRRRKRPENFTVSFYSLRLPLNSFVLSPDGEIV